MQVSLKVRLSVLAAAISAAQCTPAAQAPITQPVQVMVEAWGPFARQCATTRVAHYEAHRQLSPNGVVQSHTTCIGLAAFPNADGSVELTASMNADDPSANPIIFRLLRNPSGAARTAMPGESGLLAYGSDVSEIADVLARDIGITTRQMVGPNQRLWLPIRLRLPFPVDSVMTCQPNGETADHDRRVLALACALDQQAKTDRLDAEIHLTGEQEVDIATGVRLSGDMTGWLRGQTRATDQSPWQPADEQLWYSKETEFD